MLKEKLIEEFDAFAPVYDEVVTEELGYCAHTIIPPQVLKRTTSDHLLILDLGCGTGIGSDLYIKKKHSVTGIDISPEMITVASERQFSNLLCQDIDLPLNINAEYDVVQMLAAIDFISNPQTLLIELNKNLVKGGLLAITFPLNRPDDPDVNVNVFTEESATEILEKAGYTIEWSKKFHGYDSEVSKVNFFGVIARK